MVMNKSLLEIKKERENLYHFNGAKLINSRLPLIKRLVKNKIVLDIGSVQHNSSFEASPHFLFKFLVQNAKSVVGIDKEEKEVRKLREKGYKNIIVGNAESAKFDQRFDVIVAGNVLEHLSNPGLFLANMKQNLIDNGKIVITTDNEGGFVSFFHTICLGYIPENPDHTMIFNYSHLRELVTREGLKIEKYYYYTAKDVPRHHSDVFVLRIYSIVKWMLLSFFIRLRKNFAPGCILILTKK